jgi:uncharacterized protein
VIVVADTSVILNLCCVGQEELLRRLFTDVFIPSEVGNEFERAARAYPRFAGLKLPAWTRERRPNSIPQSLRLEPHLGPGETGAIALAIELGAYAVLIDETHGREAARRHGVTPIGVLGVLVRARKRQFVVAIRPIIEALESKANFWVRREIRDEVLRSVGEQI